MTERYTTENPKGNVQGYRNMVYIKDREVWLRGMDNACEDINLYDYVRKHKKYYEGESNEEIGWLMCDEPDEMLHLMYWLAVGFAEVRERLKAYEETSLPTERVAELAESERDGRLVVLPCSRPKIVCLCGSTRFYQWFDSLNLKLTLEGIIVLSIGCNTKSDDGLNLTHKDKQKLDELHKRKSDLCDSVLVLNVDGYIGDSTRSEIEYAEKHGKPVHYLFPRAEAEAAFAKMKGDL